jgi:hypothetical protein
MRDAHVARAGRPSLNVASLQNLEEGNQIDLGGFYA